MANTSLSWQPEVTTGSGPAYEQIARALAADIRAGRLRAGEMLPPHRDLAHSLGVSVGTITRAYHEVTRDGLLTAGGRRGTRVSGDFRAEAEAGTPSEGDIDLRGHASPLKTWGQQLRQAMMDVTREGRVEDLFAYDAGPGSRALRYAGARWLQHVSGEARDPGRLVVSNGAQHALLCSLLTVCRGGDPVAVERLTHAGLRAVAATLGLSLVPIEMDAEGLCPESLEKACRAQPIKVLVTVADIHNPTTVVQTRARRQQIASVAKKFGLVVVEDAVYAGFSQPVLPPIGAFLPEQAIRIVGLSKTVGPGLRVGFIEAPGHLVGRLAGSVKGTTWMTSPIQAEIARHLLESGAAEEILHANRAELSRRSEVVRRYLGKFNVRLAEPGPHAWLELPAPWTSESFVNWAQRAGFLILSADGFAVSRENINHAVRISISAAPDIEQLQRVMGLMEQALLNAYGLADTPL